MIRNLKALGLALGAILALGALSAASASAQGERFHADEENVILTGESANPTLGVGSVSITCATGTYEGTEAGEQTTEGGPHGHSWTSTTITVHPKYDDCEIFGFVDATVTTDGCDFVLTSHLVDTTENEEHAEVEVECTDGKQITIAASGCTVKIGSGGSGDVPENTLGHGVVYENLDESEPTTVTVDSTVTEIPYTSSGLLCGFFGIPSSGHNGIYIDDVVVEGTEDLDIGEPCTINAAHELKDCDEGKEVNVWWE